MLGLGFLLGEPRRSVLEIIFFPLLLLHFPRAVLTGKPEISAARRAILAGLGLLFIGSVFASVASIIDVEHSGIFPPLLCFAGVAALLFCGLLAPDPEAEETAPPSADRDPCESPPPLPAYREPGGPGLFDDAQQR